MPLYEYECEKCGHRFEKIQKFSDKMVKKCPECGGKVEQMISAPAVQFKGSGWYVTDYANKSHRVRLPTAEIKTRRKKRSPSRTVRRHESSAKVNSSADSASKESSSKDRASKDSSTRESATRENTRVSSSRKPDKRK